MPQNITTVSISPKQAEFLKDNPGLKLSSICQREINNLMEGASLHEVEIVKLKRANSTLTEALRSATDQLDELNCNLENGHWICPKTKNGLESKNK